MSLTTRTEKLRFLAIEMQLAHRLAQFAPTDDDARMLARHVLIRAKDYIEHARKLRKPLRNAGFDTNAFHEKKEYVAKEFDAYFKTVRDKLGAHVQDLEFLERIEKWNSVDSCKVGFFADAAVEIFRLLEGLGIQGCVPFAKFPETNDDTFERILKDYRGSGPKVVSVEAGSDALSMTRPNSVTMINTTPVHARASQLALLHRWIEAQMKLLGRFAGYPNVIRVLKARLITDVISACDCMVTRPVAEGAPQEMDGLDVLLTASYGPMHPIEKFKSVYDLEKVTASLRTVRNKVGGHLDDDENVSMATLLQMLDEVDIDNAMKVYRTLRGAFEQTAQTVNFLRGYLVDGSTLYGLVGAQSGDQITSFSEKPTPGRANPIHETIPETNEAMAAKLEEWLNGDTETRGRARFAFWQVFLNSPIEETFQTEECFGSFSRYQLHSFRTAHRFLLHALEEEKDFNRTIGILELARECSSGDPEALAEVLLRFSESPQAAPYLAAVACCLGDLASWRNERVKKFLEACLRGSPPLGIQSRIGLLRMFVRTEGLVLINRGQSTDTLPNVMAFLTKGYARLHSLLPKLYLVSQFCDQRIIMFEKPFSLTHAGIRSDIVRLAGELVLKSEADRVIALVKQLADSWDYPGICLLLFDELKGGKHELLGRMLVEYACAGDILAASHDQSRRHLCGCLMRLKRYEEALQMAEALALANPINVGLQVLHAQALACVDVRRAEAVRRVAEIDALYTLDANQRQVLEELKSAFSTSTSTAE